jgi:spore coat protein U-like protein
MRTRFLFLSGLLCILASPVNAQTATTQFNVQITINAECQVNAASDLNFGTTGVINDPLLAASEIEVQCTNGTPYDIGLNAGTGAGSSTSTRFMTGPDAETVAYSLYEDAARATVWGDTIGSDTVAGIGTGSPQTFPVYGEVEVQATPSAGTYTDVVTVTLTY